MKGEKMKQVKQAEIPFKRIIEFEAGEAEPIIDFAIGDKDLNHLSNDKINMYYLASGRYRATITIEKIK